MTETICMLNRSDVVSYQMLVVQCTACSVYLRICLIGQNLVRIHTVLPSIIDIINNYLLVWIFDWSYFILLYVMNRLKENFAKNSKLPSKDSVRRSRPSPRERSSLTLPSESWDSTEPHSEVQCCCSPPADVWSTSQNGYMVFFCL